MEEKKKGGFRLGAGRKKLDDKKVPVTICVKESLIKKWGGPESLKHQLSIHIESISSTFFNEANSASQAHIQNLTKPSNIIKPITDPPEKTNFTIDTIPKTLEDIKKMCPIELDLFERGAWIGRERQKYGI